MFVERITAPFLLFRKRGRAVQAIIRYVNSRRMWVVAFIISG